MTRVVRIARHLAAFLLHFAHGAIVMAGVIVVAAVGFQLSGRGAEGLDPRQLASSTVEPGASVEAAPGALVEASAPKLSAEYSRLSHYIARRYKVSQLVVEPLVAAAVQEGRANGVDPVLILAVASIESSFNPLAESVVGAQGLMQIIPRFHADKIGLDKGKTALFDPHENMRVGTLILREYMRRAPHVHAALQQYGGAVNDAEMNYANKVLSEMDRLRSVMKTGRARAEVARDNTQPAVIAPPAEPVAQEEAG